MRITIVISSLAAGGAEKTVRDITNNWAHQSIEVTVITMDNARSDFYTLDDRVQRIELGLLRESRNPLDKVFSNISRIKSLNGAIRSSSPDVVISFMDKPNILTLIATRNADFPVVVSERTDPRIHEIGSFWSLLRRYYYPKASAIVVLTEEIREWANKIAPHTPLRTIPCAIDLSSAEDTIDLHVNIPNDRNIVISVGRMRPEKGFDVLIEAFSRIENRKDWHLVLVGDGAERSGIQSAIDRLNLGGQVTLTGLIKHPGNLVSKADLYVCPSRYEGFGNALLEAMALGLPVVSTDTSGPRDMIHDEVNGLLVRPNDPDDLARAMERLMTDARLRNAFAKKSIEVNNRFSKGSVMSSWGDLINTVTTASEEASKRQ